MPGVYNTIPRRKKWGGKTYYLHSFHKKKHRLQLEYAGIEKKFYGRTLPYKKGYALYKRKR